MKLLPSSHNRPSETVRCEWVSLAIAGAVGLGAGALLGGGGGSGGGSAYQGGAPDWYYEHLRHDIGEPQAEMAQEMYNFYQYGQAKGVPTRTTDPIKTIEFDDTEKVYETRHGKIKGSRQDLYNEGWTDAQIDQHLLEKEVGTAGKIYETPDGRQFKDRELAIQHGVDRGLLEAPVSAQTLEGMRMEGAIDLLPQQQQMAGSMFDLKAAEADAKRGLVDQQAALKSDYIGLQGQQIEAQRGLLPQETALREAQIGAQTGLIPQRAKLESQMIGARQELLPQETALRSDQIGAQRQLLPHETALRESMIGAQQELLPQETALRSDQIGAQRELLPQETALRSDMIGAKRQLLPQETSLRETQIAQAQQTTPVAGETHRMQLAEQQERMRHRAPLLKDFYRAAGQVDPGKYADRAAADVARQYAGAQRQIGQAATRTGAAPGSARSVAMQGDLQTARARDVAAARSTGRRKGKEDRFRRLSQAVGGVA